MSEPDDAEDRRAHAVDGRVLREILDSIDMSVVVYGPDLRFVTANRGYFERFPHIPDDGSRTGWTFERMLRRTLVDAPERTAIQPGEDVEAFIAKRVATVRNEAPYRVEYQSTDGRWDLLRKVVTPSGLHVSTRVDVTAYKRLTADLAAALASVETISRAKSRFIASMSHELRTPLNAILGYAELIRVAEVEGPAAAEVREAAGIIVDAGAYLLRLIANLLDLAKIEAGRMELERIRVPVAEVVDAVFRLMGQRADQKNVTLVRGPGLAETSVQADAQMLHQMLLNLVANAVDHAAARRVTITAERHADGGTDLIVVDDGDGVPEEIRTELGDGFVANAKGIGLGLALVRAMMREHGGEFLITEESPRGSRMILRFPAPAQPPGDTAVFTAVPPTGAGSSRAG